MKKKTKTIYITEFDYQRLSGMIERMRERNNVDKEYLNKLEAELDRAEIVDPEDIPADVITMRSTVRLKDLVSGETNVYSLVLRLTRFSIDRKLRVTLRFDVAAATDRIRRSIEAARSFASKVKIILGHSQYRERSDLVNDRSQES